MKKLVVAFAALFACASIACSSSTEPTDEEVNVDIESNVETQVTCNTMYDCSTGGTYAGYSTCQSRCGGRCFIAGRCCGNACSWR